MSHPFKNQETFCNGSRVFTGNRAVGETGQRAEVFRRDGGAGGQQVSGHKRSLTLGGCFLRHPQQLPAVTRSVKVKFRESDP